MAGPLSLDYKYTQDVKENNAQVGQAQRDMPMDPMPKSSCASTVESTSLDEVTCKE